MTPEEIRAFQERDREYLRARRAVEIASSPSSPPLTTTPQSISPALRLRPVSGAVAASNYSRGDEYSWRQNGKSIMTGVIGGFDDDKAPNSFHGDEDEEDDDDRYMSLPESTHTLLITEKIISIPFIFSLGIACLSATCLLLVLLNELSKGQRGNLLSVPGGVGSSVRGAQFCGIFVGVLMEEEIGQGLILLRAISRGSFHHSHPHLSYTRFVLCCMLRIAFGYLFLLNLFVTIVQADDVITIFFDVLALEFVQKLDDVAFDVAKKDLLGRTLFNATSVEYKMMKVNAWHDIKTNIRANEEEDAIDPNLRKRGFRHLLKAVYFINLASLLTGVIIIGEKQKSGDFRCNSVNVNFGDSVWENAIILDEEGQQNRTAPLVYSYFNGIYEMDGSHDGYPKFVERNKVDGTPYQEVIGAEIKYCKDEEAWVFAHRYIVKSGDSTDTDCSWLLRSPKTSEYNLVDVPKEDWIVWTGILQQGSEISITCNECEEAADCNYHGECVDGKCECFEGDKYFGQHCQFEKPCEILIDDDSEKWNIVKNESDGKMLMSYLRPFYQWEPTYDLLAHLFGLDYTEEVATDDGHNATTNTSISTLSNGTDEFYGDTDVFESTEDFYASIIVIYAGSRWFVSIDFVINGTSLFYKTEYHAFWDNLFEQQTFYISDPATGSTPIGVDFYEIMMDTEFNDYGPFGLLKPVANITGEGYVHCYDHDG